MSDESCTALITGVIDMLCCNFNHKSTFKRRKMSHVGT